MESYISEPKFPTISLVSPLVLPFFICLSYSMIIYGVPTMSQILCSRYKSGQNPISFLVIAHSRTADACARNTSNTVE